MITITVRVLNGPPAPQASTSVGKGYPVGIGPAAVTVLALTPAVARADITPTRFSCVGPFLNTGYGPWRICTGLIGNEAGAFGQVGTRLLGSSDWYPMGDWLPARATHPLDPPRIDGVSATDGWVGSFHGSESLASAFGAVFWGTQIVDGGGYGLFGRWGNYNLTTGLFYPTTDFYPVWTG